MRAVFGVKSCNWGGCEGVLVNYASEPPFPILLTGILRNGLKPVFHMIATIAAIAAQRYRCDRCDHMEYHHISSSTANCSIVVRLLRQRTYALLLVVVVVIITYRSQHKCWWCHHPRPGVNKSPYYQGLCGGLSHFPRSTVFCTNVVLILLP